MKIRIGKEILELDEDFLNSTYIDEGMESEVFRYGKEVLKIYKGYCFKERLSEEDAIILSGIKTKRFLMPNKMIYNAENHMFVGYTLPFIYKYNSSIISQLTMNHLLNEFDVLSNDVILLSNYGIDIEDLHIGNLLYNGAFFIGDPGSFTIEKDTSINNIYRDNIIKLNRFLIDEVLKKIGITFKKRIEFNEKFDDFYYLGDQMREFVSSEKETVKHYVKKMTK